MNKVQNMFQGK